MPGMERWLKPKWIVVALMCAALFIAGMYFYGLQSEPYKAAERWARESPIVKSRVGTVTRSRLTEYDEDIVNQKASIWIDLEGAKGTSSVRVDLERTADEWIVVNSSFE
jgi:hypothetical protein